MQRFGFRGLTVSEVSGTPFSVTGWLYGNQHLFFLQLGAALTIIIWDAAITFLILKVISLFTRLRMPDDQLEIGDLAAHGEEAYPSDEGATLVGAAHAASTTREVPVRQVELQ